MKLQKLVCVAAAVLLLAACGNSGGITEKEKNEAMTAQLIGRLQATIQEIDGIRDAAVSISETKEAGKTVEVAVTSETDAALSDEQKAGIIKLVESCFNETVTVELTESGAEDAEEGNVAVPESEVSAKPVSAFLEQAYAMGYTDKQLALLQESGCSEDTILNLTDNREIDRDFGAGFSADGRYLLDGYYIDGGGEGMSVCMYLKDTQTEKVAILPDWQNGYSTFGWIDDQRFYAAVAQVGGADYEAGVRFYDTEHPEKPYAAWNITSGNTSGAEQKILLGAYPIKGSERLLAFWCEIPTAWGGWVKDDSETYLATLLDYDGAVVKEVDTGVKLANSVVGIAYPDYEKPNAMLEPRENIVFFDVSEQIYTFNFVSGETAPFVP